MFVFAIFCEMVYFSRACTTLTKPHTVSRYSSVRPVFPAVEAQSFVFLFHHNLVHYLFDSDFCWHVLKPGTPEHTGTSRETWSVKENNTVKFAVPAFPGAPEFLVLVHATSDGVWLSTFVVC